MANKKFSEFTTKTDSADVDFVVGYDGSTNVKIAPSNLSSGGTPAGSDSQLQYNNGGAFGAIPGFTYNDTNDRLIIDTTRVVFGDASGSSFQNGLTIWDDVEFRGTKFEFGDGSASAPTITFFNTGDDNTGIFRPGSDIIAFATGGSEEFRIGANGEIGLSGANFGTSGQVLTSNGTGTGASWTTVGGGASSLNGLSDVTITGSGSTISSYFVNIPSGLSGTPSDNLLIQGGGNLTTGSGNTILGDADTGSRITTSSQNVIIGSRAAGNSSAATFQNNIVIGYNAKYSGTGHNAVIIGDNAGVDAGTQTKATIIGDSSGQVGGSETVLIGREAGAYGSDAQTGAVAVGAGQCGRSNSATYTVNVGYATGYSNSSGTGNTNMGYKAGYSNTTGASRVMIGYEAGENNTGSNNVFLGKSAGKGSGSGAQTIAIGQGVMETASEASNSVFIGNYMAANCTSGSNRTVAIGTNCLSPTGYSAEGNTVVGYQSGNNLTSGDNNTLIGINAGNAMSTGNSLVSVGYQSGYSNTSGTSSTNLGYQAGYALTTDGSNTRVGYEANSAGAGANNTFIGTGAGKGYGAGTSTAGSNVAIGMNAMLQRRGGSGGNTVIGVSAYKNTDGGSSNVVIGENAVLSATSGSQNVVIGQGADLGSGSDNNSIILGRNAAGNGSNTVTFGNSSITAIHCQVQTISALSDKRDKTNIQDSNYGLDLIDSLKPVTFEWDQRDGERKGLKDLGFIAQDLQESDDEFLQLVNSNNPEKLKASYGRLIPVLVKAIL